VTKINIARVIIGGIIAGVVVNIGEFILNMLILGDEMNTAMARMNLPPVGGQAIGIFVALAFALGIATIWLYAAIRPRYSPGPKTAACAGSAVWFFAYAYPSIGSAVMGFFPIRLLAIGVIWGLGEILLAAVAGAYFYKE
jgi:hypothetical protein